MNVTETRSDGLSREYQITISASDLEGRLMKHLESIKDQVQLKGFRPGKVPVSFLRKTYGKSMMGDIIQEAVNEVSNKTLEERELRPALQPKIDFDGEMDDVIRGESDLTFSMAVEIMPDFEPGDVSDLKVERPVADVAESDIDEALQRLAEQQRTFKSRAETAKAQEGDQVKLDFVGRIDGEVFEGGTGEDVKLVLGSGSFLPGFEDQLVGAKTGDSVKVDVTFPDKYPVENLAGKPAQFDVSVKEVSEPQTAEVNDELAKQLGMEDLGKLREAIKAQIERDFARVSRERVKRNLLDALDARHDFELPAGMVDAEFEQIWGQVTNDLESQGKTFEDEGQSEDDAKAEYQAIARRRVKLGLLLAEIGNRNKIDVSQDELMQALQREVGRYPGQEQKIFDLYKSNPQLLNQIRAPLFEEKVVDYILELADVTETKVSREELYADPDDEDGTPASGKKTKPKRKAAAKSKAKSKAKAKAKKSAKS